MKANVVVMPDGRFQVFVLRGSYNEARQKIGALVDSLKAQGLEIGDVSEVESHAPDTADDLHDVAHEMVHERHG